MLTRDELLRSSDYWTEIIQNKIYDSLIGFIKEKNISNKQMMELLGLSKGRVSQILNGGNLNYRLGTIIKLCLAIEKIPDFHLININDFIIKDRIHVNSMIFQKTETTNHSISGMMGFKPGPNSSSVPLNKITTVCNDSPIMESVNTRIKAA